MHVNIYLQDLLLTLPLNTFIFHITIIHLPYNYHSPCNFLPFVSRIHSSCYEGDPKP